MKLPLLNHDSDEPAAFTPEALIAAVRDVQELADLLADGVLAAVGDVRRRRGRAEEERVLLARGQARRGLVQLGEAEEVVARAEQVVDRDRVAEVVEPEARVDAAG